MSTTQRTPLSREVIDLGWVSVIEHVARREVLDAFGDAFGHVLIDAELVRFDDAAVSLSAMELA